MLHFLLDKIIIIVWSALKSLKYGECVFSLHKMMSHYSDVLAFTCMAICSNMFNPRLPNHS